MGRYTGETSRMYIADGVDGSGDTIDWGAMTEADILSDVRWERLCKIDVNKTGSTNTSDTSDDCNPDATVVVSTTKEITVNVFVKKTDGAAPEISSPLAKLRTAFEDKSYVSVLSLDTDKATAGAAGDWMLANVSQFDESQPLKDTIQYSFTLAPSGEVTVTNRGRIEDDLPSA